VGVIGLGAGVIAAYGRAGDTVTFYEISQKVVDIESSEFGFLHETPAKTEVILGDGRLSLGAKRRRASTTYSHRCVCGRLDSDASGHA